LLPCLSDDVEIKRVALVVCAKQDLPGALSRGECAERLRLAALPARHKLQV
jgi:hypothetical protein